MLQFCLVFSLLTVAFGGNVLPDSQIDKNNDFNMELFAELIKGQGNFVYSGSSVHRLLTLTAMGARGKTAKQLKKILKLNGSDEQIKKDFKALTEQMNGAEDVTVNTAIKAYLAEGIAIEPAFQKTANKYKFQEHSRCCQ
ncbi:hypothetical protein WA026_005620 [Henosepilachna vigintioctopunctata]|uniref:Serpin domain-containing protein n=1 Tax=Henosepilachna vigintioctopunctata TaxID=420089 RepID=A0AAW1TTF3_9CUCU